MGDTEGGCELLALSLEMGPPHSEQHVGFIQEIGIDRTLGEAGGLRHCLNRNTFEPARNIELARSIKHSSPCFDLFFRAGLPQGGDVPIAISNTIQYMDTNWYPI